MNIFPSSQTNIYNLLNVKSVIIEIASHLSFKEIIMLECTCKAFRNLIGFNENKKLFEKNYKKFRKEDELEFSWIDRTHRSKYFNGVTLIDYLATREFVGEELIGKALNILPPNSLLSAYIRSDYFQKNVKKNQDLIINAPIKKGGEHFLTVLVQLKRYLQIENPTTSDFKPVLDSVQQAIDGRAFQAADHVIQILGDALPQSAREVIALKLAENGQFTLLEKLLENKPLTYLKSLYLSYDSAPILAKLGILLIEPYISAESLPDNLDDITNADLLFTEAIEKYQQKAPHKLFLYAAIAKRFLQLFDEGAILLSRAFSGYANMEKKLCLLALREQTLMHIHNKNWNEAAHFCRLCISTYEKYGYKVPAGLLATQADILSQLEKWVEASESVSLAILAFREERIEVPFEVLSQFAFIFLNCEQWQEAHSLYERIISLANKQEKFTLPHLLYEFGIVKYRLNNLVEAEAVFFEALVSYDATGTTVPADLWTHLAHIKLCQEDWNAADRFYTRAISLLQQQNEEITGDMWNNAAFVKCKLKKWAKALEFYDKAQAIPEFKEMPSILEDMAYIMLNLNDLQKADVLYGKTISAYRLEKREPPCNVWANAAYVKAKFKAKKNALKFYNNAVKLVEGPLPTALKIIGSIIKFEFSQVEEATSLFADIMKETKQKVSPDMLHNIEAMKKKLQTLLLVSDEKN